MSDTLILCDICNTMKHPAHQHEGLEICERCWPEYAENNGLCESCGSELPPIYENNGFTPPEGPSHWEVSGYKPCAECNQPEYNGDEDL